MTVQEGQEGGHDMLPRVLTAKEGRERFDRQARRELGISGDEFLRRWDAGEFRPIPDTVEGRKIGRFVMLMPFARRTNR
ncbi:MAG: hypothetical protein QM692_24220 [Thermomicrobiales bacterium]